MTKQKPCGLTCLVPSVFVPGQWVRVLITAGSSNRKTGPMLQVSFVHAVIEPHTACKTGDDKVVCGDCPQRPANGGGCYVVTCQGPLSAFRASQRGRYAGLFDPVWLPHFQGKHVRIGTYGDPACISRLNLDVILKALAPYKHTAYTHFWRERPDLKDLCMASVDNAGDAWEAMLAGWRYFRVTDDTDTLLPAERLCLAIRHPGVVQCINCMLCRGHNAPQDIVVPVHGARGVNHTVNAVKQ